MIHVDRAAGPQPSAGWFALATTWTDDAIANPTTHVVDDDTYGHAQVRMALEAVFHQKCAYCESEATATSAWDVEHFRPKGRVSESPGHPGYYWLAYTWTNLYLSCQFCNQRRRDQPTLEEPGVGPAKGKLDQFPLVDEATRALDHLGDIAAETRLLLDPCADDPEAHITFGLDGVAQPVGASAMGCKTIEVCNLDRKRLRTARRTHVELVLEQIERWRRTTPLADVLTNVRELLGAEKQRYAGAVRAICDQPAAFGIAA